ncbi:sensor histidine kinase [Streptococcus saliviloxodontae]|uniref:histidine kinase n=1 Tax=Streptococcus saliviloxodontae TaxID=1349416 RepID=A0ABS2PNI7_9STRE|nr:sensor histidine kinase [Streptococcus saliviloxodontae]MBM7636535.1 signal transduction histidine kinase [Streptococcus saliviloxodontae]
MNTRHYERYASWCKTLLIIINSLAVLVNATIYLFASKYIIATNQSHRLLENLSVIPQSPVLVYWSSLSFLAGLLVTIYLRQHLIDSWRGHYDWLALMEVLFFLLTFVALQFSYNGLILLVFADIFYSYTDFYTLRRQKTWFWFIAVSFGLLLLTNFDLLSLLIKLPDLSVYLDFIPMSLRVALTFIKNFLGISNMVVFLVSLVAFVIYSVSENHKIEEELRMADRANQELTAYVSLAEKMAEDRERKRIAREIHDTLGHALTGISAGIDAVKVLIDLNPDHAKKQLQNISTVVREGIQDVRRSLEKLRPGALERGSLKEALLKMIADYESLSKLQVVLDYDWDQVDLDIAKEDVVFRVIQESVTNSLRHGHAKQVNIKMTTSPDTYRIVISDNGQGCQNLTYGYGLTQMQERLAVIGGQVSFESIDGFETRITIPKRKGEEE